MSDGDHLLEVPFQLKSCIRHIVENVRALFAHRDGCQGEADEISMEETGRPAVKFRSVNEVGKWRSCDLAEYHVERAFGHEFDMVLQGRIPRHLVDRILERYEQLAELGVTMIGAEGRYFVQAGIFEVLDLSL